jgi:hypothetical protein
VPGAIQGVTAGLQGISEDRMVKLSLRKSGLFNRRLRGDRTQFQGAVIAKSAAILGHRRPLTCNYDDFFHPKII